MPRRVGRPGSLATLLWHRLLPAAIKPGAGKFHLFGLLSEPLLLALASTALWFGLRAVGVRVSGRSGERCR